jgi:hypothetical protein
MKALLLTLVLLSSSVVHANTFTCIFGDSDFKVTYSIALMRMTVDGPNGRDQDLRNVSFQIRREGRFELQNDGLVTVMLKLNNAGSDGVSEYIYPYDAMWGDLRGGCESDYLRKHL